MQTKSKIGVCLDYEIAYLLEEKNEEKVITIIEASDQPYSGHGEEENNFQKRKDSLFKKVFDIIKDFDKVLLFGPASLKKEIVNRIKANRLFNIQIENNPKDGLITEIEQIEFINSYFDN